MKRLQPPLNAPNALIPLDRVATICKHPTDRTKWCSYLLFKTRDDFECAKVLPGMKASMDIRRRDGTVIGMGDNCDGKFIPREHSRPDSLVQITPGIRNV